MTRRVPDEYRLLILPACYALSDIEAVRIREFCERGGTVIADFACGLFDQHGRGRSAGALDELFGGCKTRCRVPDLSRVCRPTVQRLATRVGAWL